MAAPPGAYGAVSVPAALRCVALRRVGRARRRPRPCALQGLLPALLLCHMHLIACRLDRPNPHNFTPHHCPLPPRPSHANTHTIPRPSFALPGTSTRTALITSSASSVSGRSPGTAPQASWAASGRPSRCRARWAQLAATPPPAPHVGLHGPSHRGARASRLCAWAAGRQRPSPPCEQAGCRAVLRVPGHSPHCAPAPCRCRRSWSPGAFGTLTGCASPGSPTRWVNLELFAWLACQWYWSSASKFLRVASLCWMRTCAAWRRT